MRILLVDDTPAEIFRISSLLAECGPGVQVTCACGYDAGIAAVLEQPRDFDVLLVDLHLDRADGLALISDAQDCGCTAPAVILTWDDDLSHDVRAMRAGADDYLPKAQLTPALLARTLRHAADRKRADIQLRIREARWRGLARSFPNGAVLVLDRSERVIAADGSALERLGFGSCQGRTLAEAFGELVDLAALRSSDEPCGTLIAGRHCQISLAPAIEDGSRLLVIHDRTDAVRAIEAATANERMASIGALAAGIAQEFNNLLTIIAGFADAAIRDVERPARARERLAVVREATGRARSVSDHLLAFARPRGVESAHCDVGRAIRSTVALLRGDLISRGILVEVTAPGTCRAAISHAALCQVLLNLLLNARQALAECPSGLIRVHAQAHDDRVSITVTDDGPGIPATLLPVLFRPFSGASTSGTGLGLSICRTLLEAVGGTISASNDPLAGGSFRIDLAATPAEATPLGVPVLRQGLMPPPGTLLVVEDEIHLRDLLVEEFSDSGWEVRCAEDGEAALAILAAETIDLLLLDMQMPRLDGEGVLARLDGLPSGHRPAVVVMSGNLVGAGIDAQVDGVLHKPFDLIDAQRLVAEAWSNVAGRSTPGQRT